MIFSIDIIVGINSLYFNDSNYTPIFFALDFVPLYLFPILFIMHFTIAPMKHGFNQAANAKEQAEWGCKCALIELAFRNYV